MVDNITNQLYEPQSDDSQILLGTWNHNDATILTDGHSSSSGSSDDKSVLIDEISLSKMSWIDGREYYFYENKIVIEYSL